MTTLAPRTPSYRLHKPSGQAVVTPATCSSPALHLAHRGGPWGSGRTTSYDPVDCHRVRAKIVTRGSVRKVAASMNRITIQVIISVLPCLHIAGNLGTSDVGRFTSGPSDLEGAVKGLVMWERGKPSRRSGGKDRQSRWTR